MNRLSRAMRATVVVSALSYAAQGLSLVAIPLFLSTLGRDGYGLIVTVMAFMGYVNFADAGLSWGSMILIAQAHGRGAKDEIASIVRHSAVFAFCSGLLVALIVAAILIAAKAGWRLPMFRSHPEADWLILIAGVQLVLTFLFGVFYNLFQGLQENYWTGAYQGMGRLFGLGVAMLMAWQHRGVEAVMMVQVAANVFFGFIAAVHVWRRFPWAFKPGPWRDRTQYVAQIKIGAKNFLLQIGRTLVATSPTIAISSFAGPESVPLYTVPTTLLSLFFVPVNVWNVSMQSAYGEAWTSGSKDWPRDAFRHTQEKALLLGGLGIGVFLALGDSFIRLWTHDRLWLGLTMALSVSAIVLINSTLASAQYLLTGLNRHRSASKAEFFNGLLALVFVSVAVRWFGVGAVGGGVLVAALMTSIWVLRREVTMLLGAESFPPYHFALRLIVAVVGGSLAATMVVHSGLPQRSGLAVALLGLATVVGGLAFGVAAIGLNLVGVQEARGWGRRMKAYFCTPAA